MTTNLLIVEDGGMLAANLSVVIAELGYGALNGIETAAIIPGRSDMAHCLARRIGWRAEILAADGERRVGCVTMCNWHPR